MINEQGARWGMENGPLVSNGYVLSEAPERLGWLQASDPAWPLARLQEQFEAQGYLWLRGLLSRAAVLAFRKWYFGLFAATGLLAPGSDPQEGLYAGEGAARDEDSLTEHRITVEAVRRPEYEAFCRSAEITTFYERFLGGPVHLYRRKLIRFTRPGDPRCTGAHYDMVYLRQGSDSFCSSWIPLGDTPLAMGGLTYLEDSHRLGQRLEREGAALGWLGKDLAALAEQTDRRWLVADYEAGDMVVHSPYIIHASTVNRAAGGRMRLSTDIRYQRAGAALDRRWANDWSPGDGL